MAMSSKGVVIDCNILKLFAVKRRDKLHIITRKIILIAKFVFWNTEGRDGRIEGKTADSSF